MAAPPVAGIGDDPPRQAVSRHEKRGPRKDVAEMRSSSLYGLLGKQLDEQAQLSSSQTRTETKVAREESDRDYARLQRLRFRRGSRSNNPGPPSTRVKPSSLRSPAPR